MDNCCGNCHGCTMMRRDHVLIKVIKAISDKGVDILFSFSTTKDSSLVCFPCI